MSTQLSLSMSPLPEDLIHEAACHGEPGVQHDPRYQELIGEGRARFWRAAASMADADEARSQSHKSESGMARIGDLLRGAG